MRRLSVATTESLCGLARHSPDFKTRESATKLNAFEDSRQASASASVFKNDTGKRQVGSVGERKSRMGDAERGGYLRGASVETQGRTAAWFSDDLDFKPIDSPANARSQGFGPGFFGCEARSQAFGRSASAPTVGLFCASEDAVEKPLPEALYRVVNPANLDYVDPAANNHPAYQAKSSIP